MVSRMVVVLSRACSGMEGRWAGCGGGGGGGGGGVARHAFGTHSGIE